MMADPFFLSLCFVGLPTDNNNNVIVSQFKLRWGSGVADHVSYEAGTDVTDFQIAFGALPNHHCVLDNLDYVYPHPPYDDSMVDRFSDPGAGAFTYVSA